MLNRITSKAFIKAKIVSEAKNFIPVASVKKYATDILADAFRASKVDDVASLNNGSKTFAKNFVDFLNLKSLKKSKKIKKILSKLNKSSNGIVDFTKKHSDDLLNVVKKKASKSIGLADISKLKNVAGKLFFELKLSRLKSKVEYFVKVIQPFVQKEKIVLNNRILKNYKMQKIDYKNALNRYDKALNDYIKLISGNDRYKISLAKTYLDKAKYNKEIALKYLKKAKDMVSEI